MPQSSDLNARELSMRARRVGLSSFVLVASLAAQAPPGLSVPHAPSAFFDLTNPTGPFYPYYGPGGAFIGIGAVKKPGTVNTWLVALTLRGMPGGAGLAELVIGEYDPVAPGIPLPPVWTPTPYAAGLNSSWGDRFLQFSPDGLTAVFERVFNPPTFFGDVLVTQRPDLSSPFGTPYVVSGIRGLGGTTFSGADPAIGPITVGGVTKQYLFYFGAVATSPGVVEPGIWMDELRLSATWPPAFPYPHSGVNPQLVVRPSVPANTVHSPTPIVGADGDVEGLWYAEAVGTSNTSDMWLADDLDPNTPGVLVFSTGTSWLNNGAVIGGQLLCADGGLLTKLREAWGAWLLGDVETYPYPNPVDLTLGAVPGSVAVAFLGTALGPCIPIWIGCIGLDLSLPIAQFGTALIGPDGTGACSWQPPANPALSGTTWPVQALVIEPFGNLVWTNTSRIKL